MFEGSAICFGITKYNILLHCSYHQKNKYFICFIILDFISSTAFQLVLALSADILYHLKRFEWQLDVCPRLWKYPCDSTLDKGTNPSLGFGS